MRRVLAFTILAAVWIGAYTKPSLAGTFEWHRLAGGLDVQAAQFSGQSLRAQSFLPGAFLSYSVTSGLSAAATVQRDFPHETTVARLGARFKVLDFQRGAIAIGGNLVGYGDTRAWLHVVKPTSFETTVNGAYELANDGLGRTVLWGIAGASFDAGNDLKEVRVGLRWCAFGGSL